MAKLSDTTLTAYIDGISLIGPGIADWSAGCDILKGDTSYQHETTAIPAPMSLPPAERRRSGQLVKLTLAVGLAATEHANMNAADLSCVYTSSSGDGKNCHEICQTLASDDRHLSPTRFHNSVHNAAAGYWSIATGAKKPISVLCAYDASFGAGLLETICQVATDNSPTLLIACDTPYPEPLNSVRPIPDALGVGLVISPTESERSLAKINMQLTEQPETVLADPALEQLRTTIPTARSLPLLTAIAQQRQETITLDYLEQLRITVDIAPC